MSSFDLSSFESRVSTSMQSVRTILLNTRRPAMAADVSHRYQDKYGLAEFTIATSLAALLTCFESLGVDAQQLQTLTQWVQRDKRSVTFRLLSEQQCSFLRENKRRVESTTEYVTERSGLFGGKRTTTEKVVTFVDEWFWRYDFSYQLVAFPGNDASQSLLLFANAGKTELVTLNGRDRPPHDARTVNDPIDVNVTWFFQHVVSPASSASASAPASAPADSHLSFRINRDSALCRTPRRNPDVDAALAFFQSFYTWTVHVDDYLVCTILPVDKSHGLDLSLVNTDDLFNPILPLFEATQPAAAPAHRAGAVAHNNIVCDICSVTPVPGVRYKCLQCADYDMCGNCFDAGRTNRHHTKAHRMFKLVESLVDADPEPNTSNCSLIPLSSGGGNVSWPESPVLPIADVNVFLREQKRALLFKLTGLGKAFPCGPDAKLISISETTVMLVCRHAQALCQAAADGVDYIESMLRRQLVAAIGKTLTPSDFTGYMTYHARKLYRPQYQPVPFCYAIRRPNHTPEGEISIEWTNSNEPIPTLVRQVRGVAPPMSFALNAATNVSFRGKRYLHAMLMHAFGGDDSYAASGVSFKARTRQFSSFMVILGTILSADSFDAKHAILFTTRTI